MVKLLISTCLLGLAASAQTHASSGSRKLDVGHGGINPSPTQPTPVFRRTEIINSEILSGALLAIWLLVVLVVCAQDALLGLSCKKPDISSHHRG